MGVLSQVSLIAPSSADHLDLIQAVAEQVAQLAGLTDERQLDFGLAVREGAINAMKHGHKFDAKRTVRLEFRFRGDCVEVSIVDHGPGFDPTELPDPRSPENLLRSSGRGLFLIRSLVDQVHFIQHDNGMELLLRKRVNDSPAALKSQRC